MKKIEKTYACSVCNIECGKIAIEHGSKSFRSGLITNVTIENSGFTGFTTEITYSLLKNDNLASLSKSYPQMVLSLIHI